MRCVNIFIAFLSLICGHSLSKQFVVQKKQGPKKNDVAWKVNQLKINQLKYEKNRKHTHIENFVKQHEETSSNLFKKQAETHSIVTLLSSSLKDEQQRADEAEKNLLDAQVLVRRERLRGSQLRASIRESRALVEAIQAVEATKENEPKLVQPPKEDVHASKSLENRILALVGAL